MSIEISDSDDNSTNLPDVCFASQSNSADALSITSGSSSTIAYSDDALDNLFDAHSNSNTDSAKILTSQEPSSKSSSQSSNSTLDRRKRNNVLNDIPSKKQKVASMKTSKKEQIATHKAQKKAAMELNKMYKPGECLKRMHVEMHPDLRDSWYCADVQRELSAVGVHLESCSDICDTRLVMWSRVVSKRLTNSNGQLELSNGHVKSNRCLLVTPINDIVDAVIDRKLSRMLSETALITNCVVTLVVFGVREYFRSSKKKTNLKKISEIDLEMAITDLLVSAKCDTIKVDTSSELALTIVHFTKAIAEEPYKKAKYACDDEAEFFMRGTNKKCVAVDKNGNGLCRLWQQMVAMLPLSTLDTSRALCEEYPSPLALFEALQLPNSINNLADLGVIRSTVPGTVARRLGPEFARKLATFFTSDDGDTMLD